MRIGDSYRWPDGTIVTLDSLTMTGSFNASYEWPEERGENRRALVTIPACDLYVLLSKGIVRPVSIKGDDTCIDCGLHRTTHPNNGCIGRYESIREEDDG